MDHNIQIDSEFQALIPPLSAEERAQLEANIVADGCRDPLVVWGAVLIDGHNRYEICTRLGLPFEVVSREFDGREAVMDWMDANQLGRRNITPDQFTLLLGRRYNRAKKAQGGRADREFGAAKVTSPNTAEKLAAEHGVSEKTVRNAGQYAEAVAAVEKAVPGFSQAIAAPRQAVIKAAGLEAKELKLPFNLDKGQLSRWQSGDEGIKWPKLQSLMDACGNDAPLLWMAHDRGYEVSSLHKRESLIEKELARVTRGKRGSASGFAGLRMKQIRYAARFTYWLIRHRSISCARWVMDYEGKSWK